MKKKKLTVRCDEYVYSLIVPYCKKYKMSINHLINEILFLYLVQHD